MRKNLLFFIQMIPFLICGQEPVRVQDSLFSATLKEQRHITIAFPRDHQLMKDSVFEVVYCLDDISDYQVLQWHFLQGEGFLPNNMIMVGITNPKVSGVDMRDRDFTPTHLYGLTGGADQFLEFLDKELLPFITKKYKGAITGNTLYGGSLGGLLAIYTLLKKPELFTSYVAIDPSLWWQNKLMSSVAMKTLQPSSLPGKTLFIAGRKGNAFSEMGIADFDSVLRKKASTGLSWQCVQMENETHYSTNFKGFWDGLKFSYGGFYASAGGYHTSRRLVIKPKTGNPVPGKAFVLNGYNLGAENFIHYTTDGTEPTVESPLLSGEETTIVVNGKIGDSVKIRVKAIGARTWYNRSDSSLFLLEAPFRVAADTGRLKAGGLRYSRYEGHWNQLPSTEKLNPVQTGVADQSFKLNEGKSNAAMICTMNGYLKISEDGYYILEWGGGNSHSRAYLDDKQILGNRFIVDEGEMFLAFLPKGFHKLKLIYFRKQGGAELAPLYIKPSGKEDFEIPTLMLYHDNR